MPVVFDISLPVTEMEGYVAEILARLEREWPAYRRFVFGHLGDGNLHVIAAGPPSREARQGIERCVYEPSRHAAARSRPSTGSALRSSLGCRCRAARRNSR